MIAPLRKRHFRMWLGIALLIPALAIAAYTMAPVFPHDNYGEQNVSYPELLRSVVSKNYVFNLKKGYSGAIFLEVMQISKISPASELVSISYPKDGVAQKVDVTLGMMGDQKTYLFNMKDIQPPYTVEVTDTIRHEVLATADF